MATAKKTAAKAKAKAKVVAPTYESKYAVLPIASVVEGDNARKDFDKGKMASLVASVLAHGILEPLLVQPEGKGKYVLIAGARRLRAAKQCKHVAVPVRVLYGVSEQALVEMSAVENLQRDGLKPFELVDMAAALVAAGGDVKKIAVRIGATDRFVYQLAAVGTRCSKYVLGQLKKGKITLTAATELVKIPTQQQQAIILRALVDQYHADAIFDGGDIRRALRRSSTSLRDMPFRPKAQVDKFGPSVTGDSSTFVTCDACSRKTASQPLLFDEGEKVEVLCLDPECYARKLLGWREKCAETFVAGGATVLTKEPSLYTADAHNRDLGNHRSTLTAAVRKANCAACSKRTVWIAENGTVREFCQDLRCLAKLTGKKHLARQEAGGSKDSTTSSSARAGALLGKVLLHTKEVLRDELQILLAADTKHDTRNLAFVGLCAMSGFRHPSEVLGGVNESLGLESKPAYAMDLSAFVTKVATRGGQKTVKVFAQHFVRDVSVSWGISWLLAACALYGYKVGNVVFVTEGYLKLRTKDELRAWIEAERIQEGAACAALTATAKKSDIVDAIISDLGKPGVIPKDIAEIIVDATKPEEK